VLGPLIERYVEQANFGDRRQVPAPGLFVRPLGIAHEKLRLGDLDDHAFGIVLLDVIRTSVHDAHVTIDKGLRCFSGHWGH